MGVFVGAKKRANYEATFFQQINRWILAQSNSSWDFPENIQYTNKHFEMQIQDAITRRIESYKRLEYLGLGSTLKYKNFSEIDFIWGWKDPVNTITLPIWKNMFPNAKIINIVRNPIDVAASLKYREDKKQSSFQLTPKKRYREWILDRRWIYNQSYYVMDIKNGVELWKKYVMMNEKHLAKNDSGSLSLVYEKLLANPATYLNNLAQFLGIELNKSVIDKIATNINSSNRFKFLNDAELVDFYKSICNDSLLVKYGYHNLA